MKLFAGTFAVVLWILLFSGTLSAQISTADSAFYKSAIANTINLYYQSTGDQSRLYNGSQYPGYNFPFKEGIPFFQSEEPTIGLIVYDDILYDSVLLLYDEVKDVLIFKNVNHNIQLVNEKVSQFNVWGNNFIRIVKDTGQRNSLPTGFYKQLYKGKISILQKEAKFIQEQINNRDILRYVVAHNSYHLHKGDMYYPVNNKRDLLDALKDKKSEIQNYIHDNHLKFRKHREELLIKVASYYDSITGK